MKRLLAFVWKTVAGVALCLTPVTAVLVVGWISRAMQRSIFKAWFNDRRIVDVGAGFDDFVREGHGSAHLAGWPNWIIAKRAGEEVGSGGVDRIRRGLIRLFGSLWSNLKLGLQMLLNTWVLTLPAGLMWAVSWWGGWENSFNKGYEQAAVGPAIGLAGVAMFLAAMTYVPLAQARQAATGNWKSFYDFKFLRTLARQSRWRLVWLAIAFVVAGLILSGVHVGPLALGNMLDGQAALDDQEIKKIAGLYHLFACAVIFALAVVLRIMAAKLYAGAVRKALRRGAISPDMLADNERAFLARLDLLETSAKPAAGLVARTVVMSGRGIAGIALTMALLTAWLVFVAELFVSQFLNLDWVAWLNLPLIQLPWFHGPG